jgi:hypothetical protein
MAEQYNNFQQTVVTIVKFLAEWGLALYSGDEILGSSASGNFTGILKFFPSLIHSSKSILQHMDANKKKASIYIIHGL